MKRNYKPHKTIDEQIKYLHDFKNVEYNTISTDEARKILYEDKYINVITPFKHRFARKDKHGNVIRDDAHQHIYDRLVEFSEYNAAYEDERAKYPVIYSNIQKFETLFNAVVAYEIIEYYDILTYEDFLGFISDLRQNLMEMEDSGEYNPDACANMRKEINDFDEKMAKYDDIYIFMDRLSLSNLITVFRCCNRSVRSKIYKYLQAHDGVFGYMTFESFDDFLARIVSIRNCICHFDSLEVVTMYLRIKTKELRPSTDRKKYQKIIRKLSGEL